jgi:hypothetical protein
VIIVRVIEIIFTSFMVPALIMPVLWGGAWLLRRPAIADADLGARLGKTLAATICVFALWLLLVVAATAGLPLHAGGLPVVATCWLLYIGSNGLVAWLLLRFIVDYGRIQQGVTADRLFLRFVGVLAAQPVATAAAFAVINSAMGLVWNQSIPALPAIQEGI